jgi:hypothetical protein
MAIALHTQLCDRFYSGISTATDRTPIDAAKKERSHSWVGNAIAFG